MVQNKFKRYEKILKNPTTVKMLALQIKQAADDYIALKISENEFTELILYYARYHGCHRRCIIDPGATKRN